MKHRFLAAGIFFVTVAMVLGATFSPSTARSAAADSRSFPRNFVLILTIVSPVQTATSVEVDNSGNIHVADTADFIETGPRLYS